MVIFPPLRFSTLMVLWLSKKTKFVASFYVFLCVSVCTISERRINIHKHTYSVENLLICELMCVCLFQNGRTPLHHSCEQGHIEITRWLVEEVQVDMEIKDEVLTHTHSYTGVYTALNTHRRKHA